MREKTSPPSPPGLVTVMVGNTSTSAACWSPVGRILRRQAWPTGLAGKALAQMISALVRWETPASALILAGVVPAVVDKLARALKSSTVNRQPSSPMRFREDLPCPLRIRPQPARRVGDDRLAAALGALAIDADVPWVVVDAGTALTVNGVRPAPGRKGGVGACGVFEGGLIIPGEQLALSALGGGTAQLPKLEPLAVDGKVPVWGRSTGEAIRFGIRRAQMVSACELARAQAERLGHETRIVLTGGGAGVLWPAFRKALAPFRPVRDPDLVHRGLRAVWVQDRCCSALARDGRGRT